MPTQRVEIEGVKLDQAAEKFLSSKGKSTATAYGICLRRFQVFYGKGLGEYVSEIERQSKENEGKPLVERTRPGEDTARDFIAWHQANGYSNKATRLSMAALQNGLKFYGLSLSWGFIELPPNRTMPQNGKHSWTLDEMRQLVEAAEYLRDKAIILTAFQTGLGVSDIVNLNYGEVRRDLEAGTLPLMLHIHRQKTGVEFRTFLGRDSVAMLREYLKSRGPLQNDDPLFTMLGSTRRITREAIERQLRTIQPKLPFLLDLSDDNGCYNPGRPHSLRSAFRSRLTGKMADTLIEFMLGHDIGEEKRAYLNLPVEELRELYSNYEVLLKIEKTSREEAEEKTPQPLAPEAMAQISKLEASTLNLVGENTDFKQRVQDLELNELKVRNQTQDREAKLQGEVDALKKEVEYIRDIAVQMIGKYRVLKDVAPAVWEEIERKTVSGEILNEARELEKEAGKNRRG